MKAILEFNLDNLDDELAHNRCIKAKDMAMAIWEFDSYLRGRGKYNDDPISIMHREELRSILDQHNLVLDNLIN